MAVKVLTIGTFDLYHYGHAELFKKCAALGEVHVGVNSDEFVKEYKKQAPVMSLAERLVAVESNKHVTKTYINDSAGYELIATVKPDLLVVGSDWLKKDYCSQIGVNPDNLPCPIAFVNYTKGISTTDIKKRIQIK